MLRHPGLVFLSLLLCLGTAIPVWGAEVGEAAPDFTLSSLEGEPMSLSFFRGKVPVLLYFWATWCTSCKEEMPKLNRIAADFGPKGLAVIGINVGVNDSVRKAKAYRKKHGLEFPLLFDEGTRVTRSYGVWGAPTILIMDSRGIVRFRGASLPDDLEVYISQQIM